MKTRMMLVVTCAAVLMAIVGCGGGGGPVTYTVTYDGNGNTGGTVPVDDHSYEDGDSVTVINNTGDLVRTGYYFTTWNTQADGEGTDYSGGDTFDIDADEVTLYAKWGITYEIGDTGPAGGLIFYDKGSFTDGWRYLEAAPSDQSTGIRWYNGTYVVTSATATGVGTGQANTDDIIAAQGDGSYAAQLCNDLELGGYDDWFLPSADELDAMYLNLAAAGHGGFASVLYWTSTETIADFADCQYMDTGSANDSEKNNTYRVRAARAF